ncbi:MAG: hypothetical protein ACI8T1_005194 [Verrucomicrobiales bacterium]|jgi:hypothetical protein
MAKQAPPKTSQLTLQEHSLLLLLLGLLVLGSVVRYQRYRPAAVEGPSPEAEQTATDEETKPNDAED